MGDDRLRARATWLATVTAGRFSRRLVTPLVTRLWFTPWRTPLPPRVHEREAAWLTGTRPIRIAAGGRTLTGFTAGEGPTVLLVHGWADRASALGAFIAPLTRAGYRVVGVDLAGHGASPDGPTDLYAQATTIRDIAARVGDVTAVIAHSMGGASTVLALRDGLDVDVVVLIAPAVRLEHALADFARQARLPARATAALRAELERRFGPQVWADVAADRIAPALDVPALIVAAEDDPRIDVADARLLAGAWPDAELVEVPTGGHVRLLRDPAVLERVVGAVAGASSGRRSSAGRRGPQLVAPSKSNRSL